MDSLDSQDFPNECYGFLSPPNQSSANPCSGLNVSTLNHHNNFHHGFDALSGLQLSLPEVIEIYPLLCNYEEAELSYGALSAKRRLQEFVEASLLRDSVSACEIGNLDVTALC